MVRYNNIFNNGEGVAELSIQQKKLLQELKQANPQLAGLSDEEILSVYAESLSEVHLNEDEQVSIMSGMKSNAKDLHDGLMLETTEAKLSEEEENILLETLKRRIDAIDTSIVEARENNGLIGKVWHATKNTKLFDLITDSTNDIQKARKIELDSLKTNNTKEAFKKITGLEYTKTNIEKFLNNEVKTQSENALEEYKIGQKDSADFVSDISSGMISLSAYTAAIAAVATAGVAIPIAGGIALTLAAIGGVVSKLGVKILAGEKDYKANWKDVALGAVNGLISPISAGFGGRIAASFVKGLGGTVAKEGTELITKEAIENVVEKSASKLGKFVNEALVNPMGNVYGGNLGTKITGYGIELGFDGGVSGAADAATRTACEGGNLEDVGNSALSGFASGVLGGWTLGGLMKGISNSSHKKGAEIGEKFKPIQDTQTPNLTDRIANATTREDFSAISKEIQSMPEGAEKEVLKLEYIKKQQEWNKHQSDIRMEYQPKDDIAGAREEMSRADIESIRKLFDSKYVSNYKYKDFLTFVREFPDKKQIVLDLMERSTEQPNTNGINFLKNTEDSCLKKSNIIDFIVDVYLPNANTPQGERLFRSFCENELDGIYTSNLTKLAKLEPERLEASLDIIRTLKDCYQVFPFESKLEELLEADITSFARIKPIFKKENNLDYIYSCDINLFKELLKIDDAAVFRILNFLSIFKKQEISDSLKLDKLLKIAQIPETKFEMISQFLMDENNSDFLRYHYYSFFNEFHSLLIDPKVSNESIRQILTLTHNSPISIDIKKHTLEQIDCLYRFIEINKKYRNSAAGWNAIESYMSLPINKFNAIIELLKIPAKKANWETSTNPNYMNSTFEKIKTLDDSCLESIVKIGTLMKNGEPVLNSQALNTLLEQDSEYINLIVKRFLENPDSDVQYLYKLINEPLNKLKDPKLVLTKKEEIIESSFASCTSYKVPTTKLRKLCSDSNGNLDETIVNELVSLSETHGSVDAYKILSIMKKNGKIDIETISKISKIIEKLYNQEKEYQYIDITEIFSFGLKYGDGFETVLDSLIDTFRRDSFKISNFIKYAPSNRDEIIEMMNLYKYFEDKKILLGSISTHTIDNLLKLNPESSLEIIKVITNFSNINLLDDILTHLSPEDLCANIKLLEHFKTLSEITRLYGFEMEDYLKMFNGEKAETVIECINFLSEQSLRLDSSDAKNLLSSLNKDNYALFKKYLDKFDTKKDYKLATSDIDSKFSIGDSIKILKTADTKEKVDVIDYLLNKDLIGKISYSLSDSLEIISNHPNIFNGIQKYDCSELCTNFKYLDNAKQMEDLLGSISENYQHLFFDMFKKINENNKNINIDKFFNTLIHYWEDFKSIPVEKHEFLIKIINDTNNSSYSIDVDKYYKEIKKYFDLVKNIDTKDMETCLKMSQFAKVDEILPILNAKSSYNKEAYNTLMEFLYMEYSPLTSTSIKAILEQPYDKEIFDYIMNLIKNPNENLNVNFAAQFVRFGKEGLENLKTFLASDDSILKIFKTDMAKVQYIKLQPFYILNEILTEIRTTGSRKCSVEIIFTLFKNFKPDLFKKLYRMYDKEGNHIIPEEEIFNLMQTPDIARKVLNESSDAIKKLDLSKIEVTQAMVDDFIQNLSNEFKVLLFDKNGEFTIDSYKKLLNKLNDNQYLREALKDYTLTGKIDLSIFKDSTIVYSLLSPSAEFSKLLKTVPEIAKSNPNNFYKLYSDLDIVKKEVLQIFEDYITKNPGKIPNFLSKQDFIEYAKDAINSTNEFLKPIAYIIDTIGLERTLKIMNEGTILFGENEAYNTLCHLLDSTNIKPSLKKVLDLGISDSDLKTILRISNYVSNSRDISISEIEFIKILENISAKGKLDKVDLLNLVYDKFLMSSIEFKSLTDEQLKIVADFDLITNANIKIEEWYDFVTLTPEIQNVTIKLMKDLPFKQINNIINITDERILNATLVEKIELVSTINELTDEQIKIFEDNGIPLKNKIDKISTTLEIEKNNIPTNPVSQKRFLSTFLGNNNPKLEKAFKSCDFDSEVYTGGIPMKYSRRNFAKDIKEIVSDLSVDDKNLVYAYFNIQEGADGFDGIPMLPEKDINIPTHLQSKIDKINEKIIQFTTKNEVLIDETDLKEIFDSMIQGLPEFAFNVGKKQHGTHKYTVDIHSLKVIQYMMNDPDWSKLSDEDKFVAKFAVLVHDFGKKGGVIDNGHADLSADFIVGILDKFNIPESTKFKIIEIVQNHHWFEKYNKGELSVEKTASLFRYSGVFEISKLFAKGDLSSVSDDFHHRIMKTSNMEEFEELMAQKFSYIEEKIKTLIINTNFIFDRKILKKGEKFPVQETVLHGKKESFKVLNLTDKNLGSLEQYGFPIGTTIDNLRILIHMPTEKLRELLAKMQMSRFLSYSPHFFNAQSTTLMKASDISSYSGRQFGFISDIDQANISSANFENFGSGYKKGLGKYSRLLFSNDFKYVKEKFYEFTKKKGYEINDDIYYLMGKFLQKKKHITSIYNKLQPESKTYVFLPDGKVKIEYPTETNGVIPNDGGYRIKAKDLREIIEKSEDELYKNLGHNEIVAANPRIIGLIAKVSRLEDCPEVFLQYAKDHDLPIILVGN